MEVPKEWKGTPEQWEAVIETFRRLAETIKEVGQKIVNNFGEFYKEMGKAMAAPEIRRRIKKARRQQAIRDRQQQLERSRKRQQLAAANANKSNNWRRLHGIHARRKHKKHKRKN